jgi:hypothetical protein
MRNASSPAQVSTAAQEIMVMDAEPGAFWFGAWRNVNLIVWWQGATLDAVQRLERTNPIRFASHPERMSAVHVVTETAGVPTPEARDALVTANNAWGHTVGCAVVIMERDGLVGLAVRSAVTGLIMLAPKHFRIKVFDNVDDAAPWLVEHHARSTGVQLTLADTRSVLHAARVSGR